MSQPRLNRPRSLVFLQFVAALGLLLGCVELIGTTVKTLFDGIYSTQIELVDAVPDLVSKGTHSLGGAEDAGAVLKTSSYTLWLYDLAPLPFFGLRLLSLSVLVTTLLALHKLWRILTSTRTENPFSRTNAERCQWIGVWMAASWILQVVELFLVRLLAKTATVEGLPQLVRWGLPGLEFTALLLALAAFSAAAVLRYGSDLEQESALTI